MKPHSAGYHNVRRAQDNYEVKALEAYHEISYSAKSRRKLYKPKYTYYSSTSRHEQLFMFLAFSINHL